MKNIKKYLSAKGDSLGQMDAHSDLKREINLGGKTKAFKLLVSENISWGQS